MTRHTQQSYPRISLLAAVSLLPALLAFGQPEGGPPGMPPPPPGEMLRMFEAPATPDDGTGPSAETETAGNAHGASAMGEAIIQVDPETGSLIVIGDEATHRQIERVVADLDKPVPQVLIKVLFLEVTHSDSSDVGVEASLKYGASGEEDTIETLFGLASETRGGFWRIVDDDFQATLRAIATSGKLEVLSRPSVLARNNQQATITVGQEVPFIRNSRVTESGQTINTVEYDDIGIILRVTPRITSERMVEMDVSPEISTLTGEYVRISETVNAEIIAKRSAETRVLVADGKTVVIGGMMEDNVTETVHKVPYVGDVPYLGALFRRTEKKKTKTELLIFLTPRVVETSPELTAVSVSEKNKTELAPKIFTPDQMKKYIDNLEE